MTVTVCSHPVIHVAKNPERVELPLVPSDAPGSIDLTNGRIHEILDEEVMGSAAVTLQQAWQAYDKLFSDPHVGYVDELVGIEPVWRSLTQTHLFSPKVWNDAYLAAFARTIDFAVITLDKGFSQYNDLRLTILT